MVFNKFLKQRLRRSSRNIKIAVHTVCRINGSYRDLSSAKFRKVELMNRRMVRDWEEGMGWSVVIEIRLASTEQGS